MGKALIAIISLVSIALGIIPMWFLVTAEGPHLAWQQVVTALNFIAWCALCVVFVNQNRLDSVVDRGFEALGIKARKIDLDAKVEIFINESKRYYRAGYSFRAPENQKITDLGVNLRRIVNLAYEDLPAQSAELALYDESSGQWAQSLVMGAPRSFLSQSMLVDSGSREITKSGDTRVIIEPLSFAGTVFGALRIEMAPRYEPSEADLHVAHLLAMQGALLLVDARFTEELLKMRRSSDESLRAKTGFLANLSHEIRGPLGIILNGAELVLDGLCGPVTDSQRQTVGMIKSSGEHLLDLVNDVLDYAKVEAGKVTARPMTLALAPMLTDITNVVRGQAQQKKHKLTLQQVDDKLAIICDKRHARQMLINFLTNAIKYTPEGGEISVWAERVTGGRVKISIRDSGVGIPSDQRDRVFGAFERVDDKYSNTQNGTGLGMPLTKKLAEVNDGTVDFESEQGKGSTFWVTLPTGDLAENVAASTEGENAAAGTRAQGHGEVVLLVDHDISGRDMLSRYLVHQGFVVVDATNGGDVMRALRDREIQIAIVESDMPDSSGEELIGVIRSNPKTLTVPIVFVSSKAFVFDVERFLKLGVDRCLAKPVELSEIALTVRRLLDETKSLRPNGGTGSNVS